MTVEVGEEEAMCLAEVYTTAIHPEEEFKGWKVVVQEQDVWKKTTYAPVLRRTGVEVYGPVGEWAEDTNTELLYSYGSPDTSPDPYMTGFHVYGEKEPAVDMLRILKSQLNPSNFKLAKVTVKGLTAFGCEWTGFQRIRRSVVVGRFIRIDSIEED